ncbi:hypothetical protein Ahy_A01g003500 [Arachis hypogaea]|uniref:Aminotransferase-like plant mobile domain-containing protein n=1 Tax=Arachis hypogaea TaxID=3818 RepID=A0A445ET26_ARAHY|nr:hypothetical protein Ahy_A01g003500 [Arachis hypogaea]
MARQRDTCISHLHCKRDMDAVITRQAGNDGDINRLNETTHYTGGGQFREVSPPTAPASEPYFTSTGRHRPVVPYGDVSVGGAAPRRQASRGSTASGTEEGIFHAEACVATGSCPPDAQTDDPKTLRQYARCYIMLLIRRYLMTDKSNNLVHLCWLPLLQDFEECRGSAVLAWTYQSLSLAAQRGVTDIAGCTPLVMCWIYQRFFQWCPPDRGVYQYPLAARLVGLPQQSKDQHEARVLRWRVSIDRLRFDEISCKILIIFSLDNLIDIICFSMLISYNNCVCVMLKTFFLQFALRVYDDPAIQALYPLWFREKEELGTWLSAVPLLCINMSDFTTLIEYLTTIGRGEDVWWPLKLKEWYDRWHQRFEPGRRITVHHTFDTRPTLEYYDWWHGACRVRHLLGQEVLEDPRLVELPPDVQPTASQPRDNLALPRGMPNRRMILDDLLGGTGATGSVNLASQ